MRLRSFFAVLCVLCLMTTCGVADTTDIPTSLPVTLTNNQGDNTQKAAALTSHSITSLSSDTDQIIATYEVEVTLAELRSSTTVDETDNMSCARATLTITYNRQSTGSQTYVQMTNVSGSWTTLTSGVTLSSRTVTYGGTGMKPDGGLFSDSQTYNPSSNSFSYGTQFPYVLVTDAFYTGANTRVVVTYRTYTPWELRVSYSF